MKTVIIFLLILIPWISYSQSVDEKVFILNDYVMQIYSDPIVDFSKFKSFSLISKNQLLKKEPQSLLEKQIEFFLNNVIYWFDLQYIPFNYNIKPDLLIVYNYNNYGSMLSEPETYSIPRWNYNGDTTAIMNTNPSGTTYKADRVNLSESGYSVKRLTIKTDPNSWKSNHAKKSRNVGGISFSAIIYDTSNGKKTWEGRATSTTDEADFRISGQALMANLISNIPSGSFIDDELESPVYGTLGFSHFSFCSDGQRFFPVVIGVVKNFPASKKGLKFLDVITAINGVSTVNKTSRQISLMLQGNVGGRFILTIERNGKIIEKKLTLASRPI